MILTIDAGNSRAKWKLWQHCEVVSRGFLEYKDAALNVDLLPNDGVLKVFLAEVGGFGLYEYLQRSFGSRVHIIKSEAVCLGVANSYKDPERLGIDRLLAMAEAYNIDAGNACCVIDVGTAATIDVVDPSGRHLGGHIVPGLSLLRDSLQLNTDKVRFEQKQSLQLGLGTSTRAAVENGTWSMLLAWIEVEVLRFRQGFPGGKVFLSGGLALIAAESLDVKNVIVHEDLVLDALKRLALLSQSE